MADQISDEELIKNCPVRSWQKLNRRCAKCGKEHADIEFVLSSIGLPKGYVQSGQFGRAYHWGCLPQRLKARWKADEDFLAPGSEAGPQNFDDIPR